MTTPANSAILDTGSGLGALPTSLTVLRTEKLTKIFRSGSIEIAPLNQVEFAAERGQMIAILGASGAGKSTFLHLLAALDTPTSGEVYFAQSSLSSLSEEELAEYRNESVGFVWQRHHLLPDFSAAENVAMPLLLRGVAMGPALRKSRDWLGEVGLGDRALQAAGDLSGGEQQRVAIARALVNDPVLLLADEPTGDLDEGNAESIFELIDRLHRSHQLTSILATHNLSLARRADRVLVLERGQLSPSKEAPTSTAILTAQLANAVAETPGGRA